MPAWLGYLNTWKMLFQGVSVRLVQERNSVWTSRKDERPSMGGHYPLIQSIRATIEQKGRRREEKPPVFWSGAVHLLPPRSSQPWSWVSGHWDSQQQLPSFSDLRTWNKFHRPTSWLLSFKTENRMTNSHSKCPHMSRCILRNLFPWRALIQFVMY